MANQDLELLQVLYINLLQRLQSYLGRVNGFVLLFPASLGLFGGGAKNSFLVYSYNLLQEQKSPRR